MQTLISIYELKHTPLAHGLLDRSYNRLTPRLKSYI